MTSHALTKVRFPRIPRPDPLLVAICMRLPAAAAFFVLALHGRKLVPVAPLVAILALLVSVAFGVRAHRSASDTSPRRRLALWVIIDSMILLLCAIPTPHSWVSPFSRAMVGLIALSVLFSIAMEVQMFRR
ncbi:hypothetical protein ACT17_06235 [Mycolicibacterium conceptionense]|uniref:Uncharacterized protein n=1 Tax=Mycolicibacterium conceptionense TaxID=451644 RepID=A0A0J8UE96_9MYCO|nr:hypothetical protein [Mycolicibacterium conceptionense]KMV19636.1 hypothetical protein ACT17_06235 [Mycolicibacterium conceptionense]